MSHSEADIDDLTDSFEQSVLSDRFLAEHELNVHDFLSPIAYSSRQSSPTFHDLSPPDLTPQVNPPFDKIETDRISHITLGNNYRILKTPAPIMEKLAVCRKFGGYPHENGSIFLQEFESFATLHNIFPQEHPRRIAALHLHLTGPAVTWFNSLAPYKKESWESFIQIFKDKYVNLDWQNPTILMENEVFENLKLSPGQSLEDYHCQLVEKAQLLSKPDHEILCKFIKGLPDKLAFFVRAGSHKNSASALSAAKMGEACGYRLHDELTVSAATKSTNNRQLGSEKSEISELHSQVKNLSEMVEKLAAVKDASRHRTPNFSRQNRSSNTYHNFAQQSRVQNAREQNSFSCYKCKGLNHIQRHCLWNGHGQTNEHVQCQLCNQFGHGANQCLKLGNIQHPRDTGHAPSGERH